MRQFSIRSVAVGLLVGTLMCFTNMYFGAQFRLIVIAHCCVGQQTWPLSRSLYCGLFNPVNYLIDVTGWHTFARTFPWLLTCLTTTNMCLCVVNLICSREHTDFLLREHSAGSGLQTGWVTMGSLQSAILGFGIFKSLKQMGLVSGFSIAENVIVQTTSVATATMPLAGMYNFIYLQTSSGQCWVQFHHILLLSVAVYAFSENVSAWCSEFFHTVECTAAGFVGVIPALNKLTVEENPPDGPYHFSQIQLIVWSLTLAFFGVFVAIPLRAFPTSPQSQRVLVLQVLYALRRCLQLQSVHQ
jgi:OPT oligopeptide transporter protein